MRIVKMVYTKTIPIETITPIEDSDAELDESKSCNWSSKHGVLMLFLCLILFFAGAMLVLGLIHPSFVVNPSTDKLDWGKLVLASAIFALLATIIVWIILACSS